MFQQQQWQKGTILTGQFKQYEILQSIDGGMQGDVYIGIEKGTHEKIAIKQYKSRMEERESQLYSLLVNQNGKLNHVIIIKDLIKRNDGIVSAVVMELANGNLSEYIKSDDYQKISDIEKNILFLQIIKGVQELHSLSYFHRDLKPLNIVYILEGIKKEVKLKICDFGFAKPSSDRLASKYVGTQNYRPMEQTSAQYGNSVDIWALGVIWLEMFCITFNQLEYDQCSKINKFNQTQINSLIDTIKQENMKDLLKNILICDHPDKRMKINVIKDMLTNKINSSNQLSTKQFQNIQGNFVQYLKQHQSQVKMTTPFQPQATSQHLIENQQQQFRNTFSQTPQQQQMPKFLSPQRLPINYQFQNQPSPIQNEKFQPYNFQSQIQNDVEKEKHNRNAGVQPEKQQPKQLQQQQVNAHKSQEIPNNQVVNTSQFILQEEVNKSLKQEETKILEKKFQDQQQQLEKVLQEKEKLKQLVIELQEKNSEFSQKKQQDETKQSEQMQEEERLKQLRLELEENISAFSKKKLQDETKQQELMQELEKKQNEQKQEKGEIIKLIKDLEEKQIQLGNQKIKQEEKQQYLTQQEENIRKIEVARLQEKLENVQQQMTRFHGQLMKWRNFLTAQYEKTLREFPENEELTEFKVCVMTFQHEIEALIQPIMQIQSNVAHLNSEELKQQQQKFQLSHESFKSTKLKQKESICLCKSNIKNRKNRDLQLLEQTMKLQYSTLNSQYLQLAQDYRKKREIATKYQEFDSQLIEAVEIFGMGIQEYQKESNSSFKIISTQEDIRVLKNELQKHEISLQKATQNQKQINDIIQNVEIKVQQEKLNSIEECTDEIIAIEAGQINKCFLEKIKASYSNDVGEIAIRIETLLLQLNDIKLQLTNWPKQEMIFPENIQDLQKIRAIVMKGQQFLDEFKKQKDFLYNSIENEKLLKLINAEKSDLILKLEHHILSISNKLKQFNSQLQAAPSASQKIKQIEEMQQEFHSEQERLKIQSIQVKTEKSFEDYKIKIQNFMIKAEEETEIEQNSVQGLLTVHINKTKSQKLISEAQQIYDKLKKDFQQLHRQYEQFQGFDKLIFLQGYNSEIQYMQQCVFELDELESQGTQNHKGLEEMKNHQANQKGSWLETKLKYMEGNIKKSVQNLQNKLEYLKMRNKFNQFDVTYEEIENFKKQQQYYEAKENEFKNRFDQLILLENDLKVGELKDGVEAFSKICKQEENYIFKEQNQWKKQLASQNQFLCSYLGIKSVIILTKLFHLGRYTTRLKQFCLKDKKQEHLNKQLFQSISHKNEVELQPLNLLIQYESEKANKYKQIIENISSGYPNIDEVLQEMKDVINFVDCETIKLKTKILSQNKVKLKNIIKDQDLIKTLEGLVPNLEFNSVTFFSLMYNSYKELK